MTIVRVLESITLYFSEAITRIFGPNDDAYPVIGFQPFEGDPFEEQKGSDW